MALTGNEAIWVVGKQNGTLSGESFQTTTGAIATIAGGGGLSGAIIVSSGSSATAQIGEIVVFNSASGLPKTLHAPAATGSLGIIEAVDEYGDAYNNPITFTPAGGSVVIGNQNQIYTSYGSARWRDIATGLWANV